MITTDNKHFGIEVRVILYSKDNPNFFILDRVVNSTPKPNIFLSESKRFISPDNMQWIDSDMSERGKFKIYVQK